MRRFSAWLEARAIVLLNPARILTLPRSTSLPRGILTIVHAHRLMTAPYPGSPIGVRDRAILELLYGTGLRLGEVARIDVTDLDLRSGLLLVRNGKGRKDRMVPISGACATALDRYLTDGRPELVRRAETALLLARTGAHLSAIRAFDALGRVITEENLLGEFTYTYDGVTNRLATVTYPNDQTSTYTYLDDEADHRLQTIHHKYPNAATLSKFDYTYDAAGNILTWRQQADTAAVLWRYGYDPADQLISAVKHATDTPETVLQRYAYAYDPGGNRTVEQIDDQVTLSAYDHLNRLTGQAPGGPMIIAGTLNEHGTVTISGLPAVVDANNNFGGTVPTTTGTNAFTIVAKDASGNTTTQQYEVDVAGAGKTFTYDANGNLTSDGTRTFEWDARNQLLAVNVGTLRTEFTYDGLQRRVRHVEKESSVVQSDTKVIWCQKAICEERGADGTTVTKRALGLGEQISGVARFFGTDHLGSIVALTDASSIVVARYSYDPWGRRMLTAGSDLTAVGFTGHQFQSIGSLWLAPYRAYDSDLGRWVSLDPIGYLDGPNRYQYALGNPVNAVDPLGLLVEMYCVAIGQGAGGLRGLIGGAGFKHCFLRVKCDSCEKYDYRLEITGENPPGRADIPDPQGYSPGGGNLAGVIPPDNNSQNCENEDCLLKMYQGAKSRGRRYNMFGPNSNTFVEDLLRACGMKP